VVQAKVLTSSPFAGDLKFSGTAGGSQWVCEVCGKSFKHKDSRRQHYKTHEGSTECPICHSVLSRKYELKVHMRKRHNVDIFKQDFEFWLKKRLQYQDDCYKTSCPLPPHQDWYLYFIPPPYIPPKVLYKKIAFWSEIRMYSFTYLIIEPLFTRVGNSFLFSQNVWNINYVHYM